MIVDGTASVQVHGSNVFLVSFLPGRRGPPQECRGHPASQHEGEPTTVFLCFPPERCLVVGFVYASSPDALICGECAIQTAVELGCHCPGEQDGVLEGIPCALALRRHGVCSISQQHDTFGTPLA